MKPVLVNKEMSPKLILVIQCQFAPSDNELLPYCWEVLARLSNISRAQFDFSTESRVLKRPKEYYNRVSLR